MSTNYDQPSDPSPRSIYDEDERVCDPAEKFAESVMERFDRLERQLLDYRADVAVLRAEAQKREKEIRELRDELRAYADNNEWGIPSL